MIESQFLISSAFPCRLYDNQGRMITQVDGALFPVQSVLNTQEHRDFTRDCALGWSRCPSGYAVYKTFSDPDQQLYVCLFGLKVRGVSNVSGKSPALSLVCEKSSIEQYMKRMFLGLSSVESVLRKVISGNIHEIRSINGNIYYAANELTESLPSIGSGKSMDFAMNIVALSEVLRTRMHFLDAISSPEIRLASGGRVPVYRNFDRVRKSLTANVTKKNIEFNFQGESRGKIEAKKLFDLIPFLIFENCIKYSPEGRYIDVFFEEHNDSIIVTIESLGPSMEDQEIERVFDSGFRGDNAKRIVSEGSGIGMYFLREIVENDHSGKIQFYQDGNREYIGKIPYNNTVVKVTFVKVEGGG